MKCYIIGYLILGVQFKPPITLIISYTGFALFLKTSMIITDYICIKQKSVSEMLISEKCDFV